jgi:Tfp pilus assembly protein PilN
MIEINLLPGAARKTKTRGTVSIKAIGAGLVTKVRDPYMLAAISSVLVACAAVASMHWTQQSTGQDLGLRETSAIRDSTRYSLVLRDRRRSEAKRDSVMKQLAIIRSIDNDRYVWPHVLDEISRSLPPYTWLKSVAQTSAVETPAALAPKDDKKKDAEPAQEQKKDTKDQQPIDEPMRFRIVGNTVDIQALTRFMKLLETSPFVQNVQLAKSELVMLEGKEVTEFQLDADYERPDKSVITTAPVSLSVR